MSSSDEDYNESDSEYIKLISSDGHEFYIKRGDAFISGTIKAMMAGAGRFLESESKEANFKLIPSHVLVKVCHFLTYKRNYYHAGCDIPEFEVRPEMALELLMTANYLDC